MLLVNRAHSFTSQIAIKSHGDSFTYGQLLNASHEFACHLLDRRSDLSESRVAFAVHPGFDYVMVQWAIWRAGGIAVPLNLKAPWLSHQYVLDDAKVEILVTSPDLLIDFQSQLKGMDLVILSTDAKSRIKKALPDIKPERKAMILYTSGTTGSPKGVVSTHANIQAQVETLVYSWKWTASDHIINILPLHHVHGIINVVCCALWSGAICEFTPKFDPKFLMDRIGSDDITLFMAVPTIYYKLISYYESLGEQERIKISASLSKLRLMVSGSAALPVTVLEKWSEISGHILLERYGMTEIGMAISNPYEGKRTPGHIGQPLPGVKIKLVDDQYREVGENQQGEILVKGGGVFIEYWNRPEATGQAFTEDGWFKTGDIAINNQGIFKIVGRSSVDIIKSGGYKLSALEIEEHLREHPQINDCGVVGIPSEEWGEIVAAGLVVEGEAPDEDQLRSWLLERLPGYKIPRLIKIVDDLPRNAMGKVVKMELKDLFISDK